MNAPTVSFRTTSVLYRVIRFHTFSDKPNKALQHRKLVANIIDEYTNTIYFIFTG